MVLHSTFVFCFSLCLDGLQSSKPSLGLLVVSFLFIKSGFFFILLKCPMFGLCCVFIFGLVCLISHLFTSHSTLSAFTSPQALSLWSLSTVLLVMDGALGVDYSCPKPGQVVEHVSL